MKILFLNPIGDIGGAERVLLDCVSSLRRADSSLEFSLLCLGDGALVQAATSLGVKVRVLALPQKLEAMGDSALVSNGSSPVTRGKVLLRATCQTMALARFRQDLRRAVSLERPDIVHSNGIKTHLLASLALPRDVPLVWHIHDYLSHRPVVRSLLAVASRRAKAAIAISHSVLDDARGVLPRTPMTVMMNAVDTERFRPGESEEDWLDAAGGLPSVPNVIRIGLVATYGRWKGHECFLHAASNLAQRSDDLAFRFFIIGGPIYKTSGSQYSLEELQRLTQSLGISDRVGFVPFQQNPERVYRSLDIVVHASTRPEPFGLTIAEAMACGRATVVARAGGARELFEDGVEGLGFEPGNSLQLADQILKLAQSPASRLSMGEKARAHAISHLDRTRLSAQLLPIYSSVIG